MTRDELEEYALRALMMGGSALGGAADELTFGGASRLAPETFKKLEQEAPGSMMAGRIGSAFVPYGGVLGAARLAKRGASALSGASKLSKLAKSGESLSGVANLADKIARGVGGGALEAGGQAALRRLIGGEDTGNVISSAGTGGLIGGALGAASPLAGSIAKKLYRDPRIFSAKGGDRAIKVNEEMLNEGRWGGADYFRKKAQEDMDSYAKILDPKLGSISDEISSFEKMIQPYVERLQKKESVASKATPAFQEKLNAARTTLGETPTYGQIGDYLKTVNQELSDLSPAKRSAAITGQGGEAGGVLAEDMALGSIKSMLDSAQENRIIEKFGSQGKSAVKEAKDAWSRGREVQRNLNKAPSEMNPLYVPAGAASMGYLLANAGVNPAPLAMAGLAGSAYMGSKSLTGKTGAAVGLNKLAKTPERAASAIQRLTGAVSDNSKAVSGQDPLEAEFDAVLKQPIQDKKSNPRIKQRYKPDEGDPLLKEFDDLLR